MNNKDDIDKIDEQIKTLSETNKEEEETEEQESSGTKEVENIKDLETKEEPDVEEENEKEEEPQEEVEEKEEQPEEEPEKETTPVAETKEEPTKEPPKKNNKAKIIIGVLVGAIILLLIILVVALLLRKPVEKTKTITDSKELTAAQKKEIIEEYGEALQGIIKVYYDQQTLLLNYEDAIKLVKYDYDVVCKEHEIYEDATIYLNQCSIDDEDVKYSYGKKQEKEELKEGAIKVYVHKKNKKATLKEPSDVKEYDVYSFDIEGKYVNLDLLGPSSDYVYYRDENYVGKMLNYKTREKALPEVDYHSISPIAFKDSLDQKYVVVRMNDKWSIYNLKNGEKAIYTTYDYLPVLSGSNITNVQTVALEEGIIGVSNYDQYTHKSTYGILNYHSGKFVLPLEYTGMRRIGDYIWATDVYGIGHIYDHYGKEYLVNNYDEVLGAVDEKFILVKDGKNVKLVNIQGKEIYNFESLDLGKFNYALTYKDGAAFMFNNPKGEQEALNEACIEVIYDPETKSGSTKKTYCGGIAKPILYLYPEKTTKVTVEFEHPELLETTYPKFVNKWEVVAQRNGDLRDKDDKYYYALYWDETPVHKVDFSEGYYVTKEKAIDFLEEKLSYIGLNGKERNEFITYWLPILEKNEQSLVYFELTEERESYNKLLISPKPDSLLRVVIHIKKVDKKVEIKKESLTRFRRRGFAAVEWGGMNY